MELLQPATWDEALEAKAEHPEAMPLWGGTDVMVELNFARARPEAILDLTRVPELRQHGTDDGRLRVGAGVTYTRAINELGDRLPGLAMASRTVGSPQIRNRGTIGGNIGSSSPAGDALPPLYANCAHVELASTRGTRQVPIVEFVTGPKRNTLEPDELIAAFLVPPARGPQQFSKIGTRNAMVIAVCSFALSLDLDNRSVGTCLGSAAPTPRRAPDAEEQIATELDWDRRTPLDPDAAARFGELVAQAASPIDDQRGSAAYRRHALAVLARRTLTWAWDEACA
jgi:CO/xanthine dehydrogenase FAD-binding subunit